MNHSLRIARPVTAALLLALAAGCGGTAGAPDPVPVLAPPPLPPAPGLSASGAADVRAAFGRYNKALLSRDFTTACASITPIASFTMREAQERAGGPKGATCEEAFALIYQQPEVAEQLDAASRSLTIQDVQATDQTATVTVTVAGGPPTRVHARREVGGEWRFDTST